MEDSSPKARPSEIRAIKKFKCSPPLIFYKNDEGRFSPFTTIVYNSVLIPQENKTAILYATILGAGLQNVDGNSIMHPWQCKPLLLF